MREGRPAVDAEAGNADDGELDGEHIALFAAGIVAGGFVGGGDLAVGEGGRVEVCCFFCSFVIEEADGVFGFHVHAPGKIVPTSQSYMG